MDTRSGRFPLVDSLRAGAALAILFYHLAGYAGARGVAADLARQLQFGVALFFLISGFLLYRPFVAARLRGEPMPFVGAYAWRRFLRIVPAYWVALTATALLLKPEVFDHAVRFYAFGQVYSFEHALGGLAVAWSLCVEVSFYVTLPLWAMAARRLPGRDLGSRVRAEMVALAVLAAVGVAFRIWAARGGGGFLGAANLTLPAYFDWFAIGMGLAVLSVWLEDRPEPGLPGPLRWLERRPGAAWLVAGATFAVAAVADVGLADKGVAENLAQHFTHVLVGLGLLLPAVIGDRSGGAVRRVMALPALAWIGLVSYGVFLWGGPVTALLGEWTALGPPSFLEPNLLWLVITPPVTIAVAAISYYVVERPALSLKRLVPARGGTPDQPGAVSAPALPR